MNLSAAPATSRTLARASISTSVLTLAILAAAAGPTAAAANATADITNGTLQVSGGPAADTIVLRLGAGDPNQLEIDLDGDGTADETFDVATFRAVSVTAGAGDDTVRIDQVNGVFTTALATSIDGGNGDDTLLGGSGSETFLGGNGDDVVDGNGGADTAFLGRGDDIFVWDPGDASDVVEGQNGFDTMVFNGAAANETMAATADGRRVLFTRSPGNIVMNLDGIEAIDVRTLGGSDAVTVNDVVGTDLAWVDVDLGAVLASAGPDGLADTVRVLGTAGDDSIAVTADGDAVEVGGLAALVRITDADPAIDTLVLDTLAGADDVSLDPAVDALIVVSVF